MVSQYPSIFAGIFVQFHPGGIAANDADDNGRDTGRGIFPAGSATDYFIRIVLWIECNHYDCNMCLMENCAEKPALGGSCQSMGGLFAVSLSQIYLILELAASEAYAAQKVIPIFIVIIICFACNVALVHFIRHTADYAAVKTREEMLRDQARLTKNYFETLTQQYSETRRLRHDINNHIFTVQALLKEGEVDKAKEYLSDVEEAEEHTRKTMLCDNMLISTFLNAKSESMAKEKIQLNCQAELPSEIHVTDLDLITALGNLCDNAEEATLAAQVPDPVINMTLSIKNGFFTILVKNPAPQTAQKKERRIPELDRGVGSGILRELAEKYEGEYTIQMENGICEVSLFLKV